MIGTGIIAAISRLSVSHPILGGSCARPISTSINPLFIKSTACLYAEPLKKKKRIDPAILKQREERRKKKLEKQIRRLEKNARQLKPIDELEVPFKAINEGLVRLRRLEPILPEAEEERALLEKAWQWYKNKQHMADIQMIDRLLFSQQKALDELQNESEELYQEAIQIDPELIPFTVHGPVCTPSSKDYESPDGEYIDISKKWE